MSKPPRHPKPLPKNVKDLAGRRFGRLTAISFSGVTVNPSGEPRGAAWVCKCDCGVILTVKRNDLMRLHTRSCGCLFADTKHLSRNRVHGMTDSRTHNCWMGIIKRCTDSNQRSWPNYGGRGISVCERWLTFTNFLADMGEPPDGHSIDRINNDGNYEPGNCRWATKSEQSRNRSDNVWIAFRGENRCLTDWAKEIGVTPSTLWERINLRQWDVERALTTQNLRRKNI